MGRVHGQGAPWAHEAGDEDLDMPAAAVGLCRSAPFDTTGAYAPTSDVDAIIGDPVNDTFAGGVAVSVSRDGGLTWDAPSMVTFNDAGNFFNDKEFIAAGPDGEVVVTWTRFNQGPLGAGYRQSPIVMALSRDRGAGSNPYIQFANGGVIGDYSQVAIGTDGRAHAAWTDFRGRPGVTSANQDVYVASYMP
jgi:hypothetical protein